MIVVPYADFAGFLVDLGIDSISLTPPDSVMKALEIVSKAEEEKSMGKVIPDAITSEKTEEKAKTKATLKA